MRQLKSVGKLIFVGRGQGTERVVYLCLLWVQRVLSRLVTCIPVPTSLTSLHLHSYETDLQYRTCPEIT